MHDLISSRTLPATVMFKRFSAFAALAIMQAACAASVALHAGESVDLSGRLALRGNEPFIYPVIYDARGVFELEGIARKQALALQNQPVKVHGTVVRADTQGPRLPAVHVETLRAVQP
jgi:hypothetical protein